MKRNKLTAAVLCAVMLLSACSDTNESNISIEISTSGSLTNSSDPEISDPPESSSNSSSDIQNNSTGETEIITSDPSSSEPPPSTSSTQNTEPPEISSGSAAAFYCVDDRKLLYSENIDDRIALASITKVLTACVALRNMDTETVITVGSEQDLVKPGSSVCFIAKGHKLKLKDLITGMLIASGNDAAYTVAVATARANNPQKTLTDEQAVEEFAAMMNSFAKSLGMTGSHFVNPDGWDDEEQYTTASDLIQLAKYALTVPEIREIAATHQKRVVFASGEVAVWTNSNKLLDPESGYYDKTAIGLKTGTTNQAGCCLLAAFEKNGKTYISVVMGADSDSERYGLAATLSAMG